MKTAHYIQDMENFKEEATQILESAKFPVHKWESNVAALESENMPNPGKILGYTWDKAEDTLKIQVHKTNQESVLMKRIILAQLGRVYDPLGITSPSMMEGKRIYRDTCDKGKSWNAEVSPSRTKDWNNWTKQLSDMKVPRSLIKGSTSVEAVDIHQIADVSNLACSTVAFAVIEQGSMRVQELLTSKSIIQSEGYPLQG